MEGFRKLLEDKIATILGSQAFKKRKSEFASDGREDILALCLDIGICRKAWCSILFSCRFVDR